MMSTFKMSAKHCSFTVFPMKVVFHCLLHEVNICNLKRDPETNKRPRDKRPVITGRSRVPSGPQTTAFTFIEVAFLISFDGFHLFRLCCDINPSFYFMGSVCCGLQELARHRWLWVQQLVYSPNTQNKNPNAAERQLRCHLHLYTLNLRAFLPQ